METPVFYFYRPIAHYAGRVLKCAGICTDDNRDTAPAHWAEQNDPLYLPGVVILKGYRGDRIHKEQGE